MLLSLLYTLLRATFGGLIRIRGRDGQTDLENAVLRHQLKVLSRTQPHPKLMMTDQAFISAAARHLPRAALKGFIVTPKTLLRWHSRLISKKWARYTRRARRGRPGIPKDIEELIIRLAKENDRWGYRRIHGELKNLGVCVSASTVRNTLRRNGHGPAPRRNGPTWRQFLTAQAKTVLACDFFTVETLLLKRYFVLFFIELATRRVHYAGASTNPNGLWVAQQARNLFISEPAPEARYLIHDRDSKFCAAFDSVFASQGCEAIETPYRSPRANAHAERFVKSVRNECLDHLIVLGRHHLDHVMNIYIDHYNSHRPHRALDNDSPHRRQVRAVGQTGTVTRRDRLGGLLHEYYADVA